MTGKTAAFVVFLCFFKVTTSSVLLWSTDTIEIPALKNFNDQDFTELLDSLRNPKVVAFNSKYLSSAMDLNKFLPNRSSAYVPNGRVSLQAQDLTGDQEQDFKIIKSALKSNSENVLVVLKIQQDKSRGKRESDFSSTTPTSETMSTDLPFVELPEPKGPVLYSAASPSVKTMEAMIFSSKPPLLKTNTTNISLGEATVAKMDVRDTYTRLIATIPVQNGKITLRFKFYWRFEYWYLNFVEVEFVGIHATQYNLSTDQEVSAPSMFSYHCGGEVVFRDPENGVELYLFEIQAQPDARNHRFSDDYNCVPFTTAPIWSGLFVAFILSVGLGIGLIALGSIKTMDKFDNQKTRALTITVWE